jgi:hypothetical protein
MNTNVLGVVSVVYHRNGVGGQGFHVVKFVEPEYGTLLGVVFPKDTDDSVGAVMCSVIDPTDAERCFRGDHYSEWLRAEVAKWQEVNP